MKFWLRVVSVHSLFLGDVFSVFLSLSLSPSPVAVCQPFLIRYPFCLLAAAAPAATHTPESRARNGVHSKHQQYFDMEVVLVGPFAFFLLFVGWEGICSRLRVLLSVLNKQEALYLIASMWCVTYPTDLNHTQPDSRIGYNGSTSIVCATTRLPQRSLKACHRKAGRGISFVGNSAAWPPLSLAVRASPL